MNCTQVRRFLYAFADGELPVRENCEVLDHLKMCPSCTQIVADQQVLRKAIGRNVGGQPVPADLKHRAMAHLKGHSRTPKPPPAMWQRLAPLAAAAAVVAAFGVWYWNFAEEDFELSSIWRSPKLIKQSPSIAQQIVTMHCDCIALGPAHQAKDLPSTIDDLRNAAPARFSKAVEVLVPDLSDRGYAFETVNTCGLYGANGVHLIYAAAGGLKLSLFNLPNCRLDCRRFRCYNDCRYYADTTTKDGVEYTLTGWHSERGRGTFVLCASLPEKELFEVIEAVRIAFCDSERDDGPRKYRPMRAIAMATPRPAGDSGPRGCSACD